MKRNHLKFVQINVDRSQINTQWIAATLIRLMAERGWSVSRCLLAAKRKNIKISQSTFNQILAGTYPISGALVNKLTNIFHVTQEVMLGVPKGSKENILDDYLSDPARLRVFLGGCDDETLKWAWELMVRIRGVVSDRRKAFVQLDIRDYEKKKALLLSGGETPIDELVVPKLGNMKQGYAKTKRRLTNQERSEIQDLLPPSYWSQLKQGQSDQDDKTLQPQQDQVPSPSPVQHSDPQ